MTNTSLKSVLMHDFSYVQNEFSNQVVAFMRKEGITQVDLCNLVGAGIDESKLSKLINEKNGKYGLPLKWHYLMLFIQRRVVCVKKLSLGNSQEDQLLKDLAAVLEDDELIFIISEAKKMGRDPKSVLKPWFNDIKDVATTSDAKKD